MNWGVHPIGVQPGCCTIAGTSGLISAPCRAGLIQIASCQRATEEENTVNKPNQGPTQPDESIPTPAHPHTRRSCVKRVPLPASQTWGSAIQKRDIMSTTTTIPLDSVKAPRNAGCAPSTFATRQRLSSINGPYQSMRPMAMKSTTPTKSRWHLKRPRERRLGAEFRLTHSAPWE